MDLSMIHSAYLGAVIRCDTWARNESGGMFSIFTAEDPTLRYLVGSWLWQPGVRVRGRFTFLGTFGPSVTLDRLSSIQHLSDTLNCYYNSLTRLSKYVNSHIDQVV